MQFPYLRVTVVVALIVILAIYLMLKYTRFGRSIYAVGGNQQSATLMGLDVKKTQMKAYILSSFLSSIGGICYCLNTMAGLPPRHPDLKWMLFHQPSSVVHFLPVVLEM